MASWLGKPVVDVYEDIHVNFLTLNSAYVILNTTLDSLGVYSVKDECSKVSILMFFTLLCNLYVTRVMCQIIRPNKNGMF